MSSSFQFKHVNGRNGKVESICMKCLLAAGICSSDKELAAKESRHVCGREAEQLKSVEVKLHTRPKSLIVSSWNRLAWALLERGYPGSTGRKQRMSSEVSKT
jgi:hypothetical protein